MPQKESPAPTKPNKPRQQKKNKGKNKQGYQEGMKKGVRKGKGCQKKN
jgi:hypothetical protein